MSLLYPPPRRRTRPPPEGSALTPIDLESVPDRHLLVDQRALCGWYSEKIPIWRTQSLLGEKRLFWIVVPSTSPLLLTRPVPSSIKSLSRSGHDVVPVGHVALDTTDSGYDIPQPSLASRDGSVLSISTLFVLPSFAGLGLADFAMDAVEHLATVPPFGFSNCHTLTLNVVCKRYFTRPPPTDPPPLPSSPPEVFENRGYWEMMGLETPTNGWSTEGWYEGRGYEKYDEVVRLVQRNPKTGWTHPLKVSLMRKPARPPSLPSSTSTPASTLTSSSSTHPPSPPTLTANQVPSA